MIEKKKRSYCICVLFNNQHAGKQNNSMQKKIIIHLHYNCFFSTSTGWLIKIVIKCGLAA